MGPTAPANGPSGPYRSNVAASRIELVRRVLSVLGVVAAIAAAPQSAFAAGWLPHPDGATWTYQWSDTDYTTSVRIRFRKEPE